MDKRKEGVLTSAGASPSWSDRWVTVAFLLTVLGFGITAAYLLFAEGKVWVLLIGLAVGALLWALQLLEVRYYVSPPPTWNPLPGFLAPAILITLVTFVACLPALHTYFLVDDFAFIHRFYNLTLSQFAELFHTDLGRVAYGDVRQEYRPFLSLYYWAGYHFWGLNPWGYHVSDCLLHVGNALLIVLIVRDIAPGESPRALFAGLLFAVLPVHALAMSLVVGFVTEALPAFLGLTAFLCFMRFRTRRSPTYFVISILFFIVCLMTKESAVTLPIMLVCFDLFRVAMGERVGVTGDASGEVKKWFRLGLAYVPFAVLLLAYLKLRSLIFKSFLREANWGTHVHEAVTSPGGFWLHFRHLLAHLWDLQTFNFRQLLYPYSALELGLVIGLFGAWALVAFRRRSECRRCLAAIVYFGTVWYLITNIPFIIEGRVIYHLYLPAVGLCIATAFVAVPPYQEPKAEGRFLRYLGMVFLVAISAIGLWKENAEYARFGNISIRMSAQLAAALADIPKDSLVVIWPAESQLIWSGWGEEILPFAALPPFAPTDLYSRVRIIEQTDMSCCGIGEWWEKTKPVIAAELARPQNEQMKIYSLTWDDKGSTFEEKTRVLPRDLFRVCVTEALGGPIESVNSLGESTANRFVESLARLVAAGR